MAAVTAAVATTAVSAYSSYKGAEAAKDAAKGAAQSWQEYGDLVTQTRDKLDFHGSKEYTYGDQTGTAIQLSHQQLMDMMFGDKDASMTAAGQFQMDQGIKAVQRAGASKGHTGAGKINYDLIQFSQGVAQQDYWNQIQNLMTMSGGTFADAQNVSNNFLQGQQTAISGKTSANMAVAKARGAQYAAGAQFLTGAINTMGTAGVFGTSGAAGRLWG